MPKYMELTGRNGSKMTLNVAAAMQAKPMASGGTELVFPFPLGRIQVKENYLEIVAEVMPEEECEHDELTWWGECLACGAQVTDMDLSLDRVSRESGVSVEELREDIEHARSQPRTSR